MLERSLVLLKPDCIQRRLMGRVISRFEDKGLNLIAMKLMVVTKDLAQRHYAEHLDKPFYLGLEAYITSGPILAVVIEGPPGDSGSPHHGGPHQRTRRSGRHHPWRLQHQQSHESRSRLRRCQIGR